MISVVIPAHNEERTIAKCIEAVLKQKNFKKLISKIIVIDDCSRDKTNEIVKAYAKKYKSIRLVTNKKNLGLSKTLNVGLQLSKSKYVCTLHADCILPKNFFSENMNCFRNGVAVVNSHIVLPKNEWEKMDFWNKLFFSKFLLPKRIICENKCDIYRKDVIRNFGFFSKDFRVAGEDFDLFCKLSKAGFSVYCSNLLVKHLMGSHQRGFWKYFKKEMQYGEARGAIFRKYGFMILFNPFAFRPWRDARLVVALPLVVLIRTIVHFISFWKGFATGKQIL